VATSRIFVGFSSEPVILAEAVRFAAGRIGQLPDVQVQTWEDLRTGGKVLLDTIESAVRACDLAIFDLTQLNENVMFELGLAIGADRAVWPLRDATDGSRKAEWNTLGLLDTIGQVRFTNSEQVFGKFTSERPDLARDALLSTSLAPELVGGRPPSILYLAEPFQTDAGRKVISALESRDDKSLELVVADPVEASLQSLAWFTQHIYAAEAVVVHLASARRDGAIAHNARSALVAGLARGLGKPLLMLAEEDFRPPLDYRDLLYRYPTAGECATRTAHWLARETAPAHRRVAEARDHARALELSTELQSIDLGEYVAENEAGALSRYFVETGTFREILSGASRVYVGRKGAGKSATLIQSEGELRSDKRNLVCVIKPPGYDLNGLVRLLAGYAQRDAKGFVAESLWKYLLYTELCLAIERDLGTRPAGAMPESPEWQLMQFVSEQSDWIKTDFASRLEAAVDRLLTTPQGSGVAEQRRNISEALHAGPMRQLRQLLAPALAVRDRVFILVDNLDKAWDRYADIDQLTRLILGLLGGMDNFRHDLETATRGSRTPLAFSLFLRSDIYAAVRKVAREPDKLPVRHLRWEDELPLLEVVERRFVASRSYEVQGSQLWDYFCERVRGIPVKEYLSSVTLPRPRDLLFLCRAAIQHAVSSRHASVEEKDVLAGERLYSQFAFEAVAVETELRFERVDEVLLEFAGMSAELSEPEVRDVLRAARVDSERQADVIDELRNVSFLGVQIGDDTFSYADEEREKRRVDVLAKRHAEATGSPRTFRVHPAFWSYLELSANPASLRLQV
jgi:hypothetical protein